MTTRLPWLTCLLVAAALSGSLRAADISPPPPPSGTLGVPTTQVRRALLPARSPPPPSGTLGTPTTLIVQTAFDHPESLVPKNQVKNDKTTPGWIGNHGQWTVQDGVMHGDQAKTETHHASCVYNTEFNDVLITAQIKLGGAEEISLELRQAGAPWPHIARVYILPAALKIERTTDVSKAKKSEVLTQTAVQLSPETWHDLTLEVCGDHLRLQLGQQVIDAHDDRFQATKGIFAFITRGQGAQFKNVALWHTRPKP